MRDLPPTAQVYIWGVLAAAALTLALLLPGIGRAQPAQFALALVAVLALLLAEVNRVPIGHRSAVSVATAVSFAGILLLGIGLACWATAIGMVLAYAYLNLYLKQRKWYNGAFNVAVYVLAVGAAAFVYGLIGETRFDLISWVDVAALTGAALSYFIVNTALVAGVVALRRNLNAWLTWLGITRAVAYEYFGLFIVGIAAAAAYNHAWGVLPLLIVPLIIIYHTLKTREQPLAHK